MWKKYKALNNSNRLSASFLLFAVGIGSGYATEAIQVVEKKSVSTNKQAKVVTRKASKSAKAASVKVYIDPETGEFLNQPPPDLQATQTPKKVESLRESPDDQQATQEPDSQSEIDNFSDEGLQIIRHPDGSESVDLQGRFQYDINATIDKNGKIKVSHESIDVNSKTAIEKEHSVSHDTQPVKP